MTGSHRPITLVHVLNSLQWNSQDPQIWTCETEVLWYFTQIGIADEECPKILIVGHVW